MSVIQKDTLVGDFYGKKNSNMPCDTMIYGTVLLPSYPLPNIFSFVSAIYLSCTIL
jgi:hypothetical protein